MVSSEKKVSSTESNTPLAVARGFKGGFADANLSQNKKTAVSRGF